MRNGRFLGSSLLGCVPRPLVAGCVACLSGFFLGGVFVAKPAQALPEGRHYELVSPAYKGGYGVTRMEGVAVEGAGEGERVVFGSLGTFAGAPNNSLFTPYLAQRGASGWSTTPLVLPAGIAPAGALEELTPSLDSTLFESYPGANGATSEFASSGKELLSHSLSAPDTAPNAPEPGPNFEVAGVPFARVDGKPLEHVTASAASRDLCHVMIRSAVGSTEHEPLLPEAAGTENDLYEMTTGAPGCGDVRGLGLVGVSNRLGLNNEPEEIDSFCPTSLGNFQGNRLNAVTADGEEVFFQANVAPSAGAGNVCDKDVANPAQVFVRLGGSRTLEVSRPLEAAQPFGGCGDAGNLGEVPGEVPCPGAGTRAGAVFQGADEAGTRVFFTTTAQLVPGDTDSGNDVYMASIGCPASEPACEPAGREVTSLVQVSHDPNAGEAAEVQNVSVVAPDGARVYFVARGVLTLGPNAEGQSPVKGADNYYVYDAEDGSVRFIADLCSGPAQSGEGEDPRCPDGLKTGGEGAEHAKNDVGVWGQWREVQTADRDGRFLLFTSYGRLVPGDTDTSKDVYRYDALTEKLDRVSVGEGGYDANGNNNGFSAELPPLDQNGQLQQDDEMGYRAISEDGSRVVFETADPLSPDAINGLVNAYEWHLEPGSSEGSVSLVSSGSDEEPVDQVAMTPSGRDIFFITVQGLLPQDTDGAKDVYDARLGEGFPAVPAGEEACSGDACQGPLTNPAPLLVPGSVSQVAGENFAAPAPVAAAAPKKKAVTPRCPRGRKLSRGRCVQIKGKRRVKAKKAGNYRRVGR
jgi:hypothetical protein